MGMHHVDLFGTHQLPDEAGVAQALPVAAVANGCFYLRGAGGQPIGIGQHPHGVALAPVGLGQLHGVGR